MLEKIVGYILNILLIIVTIIIAIGGYYIYQIKILKNEYADLFGYSFFEVATASMNPTILVGDVVIVDLTKDVNENDIIVYQDGKNIITHRLIKKDGNQLIAKGDANNSEDNPITSETIIGKVIKIIPKLGVWRNILNSKEVVGLIIILMTLFGITFIYTSKTEEKDGK